MWTRCYEAWHMKLEGCPCWFISYYSKERHLGRGGKHLPPLILKIVIFRFLQTILFFFFIFCPLWKLVKMLPPPPLEKTEITSLYYCLEYNRTLLCNIKFHYKNEIVRKSRKVSCCIFNLNILSTTKCNYFTIYIVSLTSN